MFILENEVMMKWSIEYKITESPAVILNGELLTNENKLEELKLQAH